MCVFKDTLKHETSLFLIDCSEMNLVMFHNESVNKVLLRLFCSAFDIDVIFLRK